ncbi:adenosine deaminase [Halomonas urumqiensis]|uniref:Adenine deaminase n=1 Tax=Halomonas urumqiensis TaxID=1684789 RepID=A0A2N7UQ23_9GAMM|nr:adenosine deaminase [Halomonas urumqiensis]PMR82511.1 adenosine deaminase [Halomonas urumqiensis]PTB04008.1 adenosine deaminase [Halomonas urumqiensis]GHE19730.1 adenine deaminase [Halomonas urumqiensis]
MMIEEFCKRMPKAELHIHLEGAIEPEMLLLLARRNEVRLPWENKQQILDAYQFTCLEDFLTLFYNGCRVLKRAEDFHDITLAYLKRAKDDNVVHAEMFLSPQSHLANGVGWSDMLDGTLAAMEEAQFDWGITSGLILGLQRHRTELEAFEILEASMPWRDKLLGIGLGGSELGNPPGKFERVFQAAKKRGFYLTAHAGEEGPAEYVRESVERLGIDRVDHGNACLDDPGLVMHLAERRTPLTLCPLSNLCLNVVDSLESHPLRTMLKKGMCVTINSDDPAYFKGYINDNLVACQKALSLTEEDCLVMGRNSIEAAFLDPGLKRKYYDALVNFSRHAVAIP